MMEKSSSIVRLPRSPSGQGVTKFEVLGQAMELIEEDAVTWVNPRHMYHKITKTESRWLRWDGEGRRSKELHTTLTLNCGSNGEMSAIQS